MHTVYYKSPIGVAKITADAHSVTELVFTDAFTNEDGIENTMPSPLLQQCILELDEFFNGMRRYFSVPVQQPGTLFQQKVWSYLIHIPYGKTVSYLSLSNEVGDVKAIRAVAASNGKNKIGILVPCHRVIGSNQSLVGYAWGTWRKKWLLAHEAKWANGVHTLF